MLIIKDKVIFIHIPKVGGTSIRRAFSKDERILDPLDFLKMAKHKDLDLNHLTLDYIKNNSKELWEIMKNSFKCCLIRDPKDRLFSSFAQYLGMYSKVSIENLSQKKLFKHFEEFVPKIEYQFKFKRTQFDKQFIHFQPQVDYIYIDGRVVVDKIFLLDDIQELVNTVCEKLDIDTISVKEENISVSHRFKFLANFMSENEEVYKKLKLIVPSAFKTKAKDFLFKKGGGENKQIFIDEIGNNFVDRFYLEDKELYHRSIKEI